MRRLFLFVLVIASIASSQTTVHAQNTILADSQSQIRDFHDKQGDVIISGTLYEVAGNDITIAREGSGGLETYNINKFSQEDRVWIRKQVSDHKKWQKKREAADKVIEDLRSSQSAKVIKACRKLKSFGSAASHASKLLNPLLKSKDEKVVLAAFVCLSNTSKVDKFSIQRLFSELEKPNSPVFEVVSERPEKFIETLSHFDKLAIPYLRAIAYEGVVNIKPMTASAEPDVFSVIGGNKSKIRMEACKALSAIKHDASYEIMLKIIEVSDQAQDAKRDAKTIKDVIRSLGRLGMNEPDVVSTLKKFESEFPEEVGKSLESLKN